MDLGNIYDNAHSYHQQGLNVFPAIEKDKQPAVSSWLYWMFDQQQKKDINKLFYPGDQRNIALVCGQTSQNIYVVDCESKPLFQRFAKAVRVTVGDTAMGDTNRGGHIFLRSTEPVKYYKGEGYEIRGQGSYVLVYPSFHPESTVYTFTSAKTEILLADSLPFVNLEFTKSIWVPRLARQIFRGSGPSYQSRSETDQAFIVSLIRAGFDYEQIKTFLLSSAHASKFQEEYEKNERRGEKWLERSIEKGIKLAHSEEFQFTQDLVTKWQLWLESDKWTGRTGLVDRAVFQAHLDIACKSGKTNYHASVRTIAEMAKVSHMTASNSHKRLQDMGLIEEMNSGFRTLYASRWRLQNDPLTPSQVSSLYTISQCRTYLSVTECKVMVPDDSAVWEWKGLGKAARAIYKCLDDPVKQDYQQIVEASGRSLSTVKRIMPEMIELGIVFQSEDGYHRSLDVSVHELEKKKLVLNAAKERKERHRKQRRMFRMRADERRHSGEDEV